jgi:hypothetical protein
MMDHETWLKSLLSVIRDLADEQYQERVWVRGQGPEVDSSTEAICRLFDDYDFEGFLAHCSKTRLLSSSQREALQTFAAAARQFASRNHDRLDDAARISTPEWRELRALAQQALEPFPAMDRAGVR